MPKYLVLTEQNRNIIIEADYFTQVESGEYHFLNGQKPSNNLVASVNHSVLAVIEQTTAFRDDFYDTTEDDDLEYRIAEFLDSQEGFNAIADVVEGVLAYQAEIANEVPSDPSVVPPNGTVVRRKYDHGVGWGFVSEGKFVSFGDGDEGKEASERNRNTPYSQWTYFDYLTETQPVEEVIQ